MKHLVEEELIGLAYGEGSADAGRHLASCGECAQAYAELKNDLAEMRPIEAPARNAAYGERVWDAIADSLPVYEPPQRRWFGLGRGFGFGLGWMRGLSFVAAGLLLIAGSFYAGQRWQQRRTATVAQNKLPEQPQRNARPIVVVVLGDHLDRSERLLVELKHVDANNADMMPPLRDEARSLLAANRICKADAEKVDDPALQTALDHLDRLLNELANQPDGLNAASISRLKDEMDADGLLFQVRVLQSRARNRNLRFADRSSGGAA
ncbi:MAG TPA: hypothetical protein VLZ50_05270 [Terracidiphilus sp.]|nr:hypothetical protein [Terracidiphilus sp.]